MGIAVGECSEDPVSIMIADDHKLMRTGLRLLLESEEGFEVIGEASDIASTERRLADYRPGVLILDVNMPDGSSVPAIPRLRKIAPESRILMVTMQNEPSFAREALGAGASGYVTKDASGPELVEAVRNVANGRTYLNPELGAKLAVEASEPKRRPGSLTDRELEVLKLIALGHTSVEIAEMMFLSARTVESHRARISEKTGRSTRAQLVAFAREHELV